MQHAVDVASPPVASTAAAAPASQASDPPPVPPLEALAGIMQGTIWSALSSASQQLHRWNPVDPAVTLSMHQVAVCEGPADSPENICSVPDSYEPSLLQQPDPRRIQQQSSDGPTSRWLQSRLSRLGSRCSDALDRLQAAGGRQLDGLQASAQQLMPWPQLQVQRQSALRVRVLSCRLRWPPVQQPDLELNLTNM